MLRIQTVKSNVSDHGFSENIQLFYWNCEENQQCVDSLVCAVASLRLISLEAVGPLSLGSSHFKKARRVASSYIYWSLKKITIFIDLYPICIEEETSNFLKVHSFLKQCFARSLLDTIWGYVQLIFKLQLREY
jgi:hypothetical protein